MDRKRSEDSFFVCLNLKNSHYKIPCYLNCLWYNIYINNLLRHGNVSVSFCIQKYKGGVIVKRNDRKLEKEYDVDEDWTNLDEGLNPEPWESPKNDDDDDDDDMLDCFDSDDDYDDDFDDDYDLL